MPRSSTIALIRRLTATRPAKKRIGRVPPPLPLDPIQREFARAIDLVSAQARAAFESVSPAILSDLAEKREAAGFAPNSQRELKTDASDKTPPLDSAQGQALVRKARRRFNEAISNRRIYEVTESFGQRTSAHQRANLDRQLRSAVGVPYEAIEKPIRDMVPKWTEETVGLIKTVPERYFDSLEQEIQAAYAGGMHPDTLAERFAQRFGVAQTNGERIARTSISQINGNLNKARQESLGVTGYVWRTMNDARVRDNHDALEGEECDWNAPPLGGGTSEDEEGHPGSGINCRCFAEPQLDGLLE